MVRTSFEHAPRRRVCRSRRHDRVVGAAYGRRDFKTYAERRAFLFLVYQKYTSLLPADGKSKRRRTRDR